MVLPLEAEAGLSAGLASIITLVEFVCFGVSFDGTPSLGSSVTSIPPGLSAPFSESEELLVVVVLEADGELVVPLLSSKRFVVVPLGEPSGASDRAGPSSLLLGPVCVVVELPGALEMLVVVVD